MRLLLSKCFLIIACIFVLAHNFIPHHHEDSIAAIQSHHDDGKDNNIFSFGQVDDNFLPSQKQVIEHIEYTEQCIRLYNCIVTLNFHSANLEFPPIEEFPPPDSYFYYLSHRGPPVV